MNLTKIISGLLTTSVIYLGISTAQAQMTPQEECDSLGPGYIFLAKYNWFMGDEDQFIDPGFIYDEGLGDVMTITPVLLGSETWTGTWQVTDPVDGGSVPHVEGLVVKRGPGTETSTFPTTQSGSYASTVQQGVSHLTFCYVEPLAVQVYDLAVNPGQGPGNSSVTWKTGFERNNVGFDVWVRCSGQGQVAVNGQGDSTSETAYEFKIGDCKAITGAAVEAVDNNGRRSLHLK